MIDNKKLLAIVIIISLAGVISLFYYSASISPEDLTISQIDDTKLGAKVTVDGTVADIRRMSDRSTSIELIDLESETLDTITVYIGNGTGFDDPDVIPGAEIRVSGIVETYEDEYEIVVSSASDIGIISPAGSTEFTLAQLLTSPDIYDGMTVGTSGEMTDFHELNGGIAFTLRSGEGNSTYYLDCVLFDNDIFGTYSDGQNVAVTGFFSYYTNTGSWQIIIDEEEDIRVL